MSPFFKLHVKWRHVGASLPDQFLQKNNWSLLGLKPVLFLFFVLLLIFPKIRHTWLRNFIFFNFHLLLIFVLLLFLLFLKLRSFYLLLIPVILKFMLSVFGRIFCCTNKVSFPRWGVPDTHVLVQCYLSILKICQVV